MTAPVFKKEWWKTPQADQDEALEQFRAAVATARTSTDDNIKQVCNWFLALGFGLVIVVGSH